MKYKLYTNTRVPFQLLPASNFRTTSKTELTQTPIIITSSKWINIQNAYIEALSHSKPLNVTPATRGPPELIAPTLNCWRPYIQEHLHGCLDRLPAGLPEPTWRLLPIQRLWPQLKPYNSYRILEDLKILFTGPQPVP